MINSKFMVSASVAIVASMVIIFFIYYLYTSELISNDVDDTPLSSQQVQACKAALIGNLEAFQKDAALSYTNSSKNTLSEWNNEFVAHQERFQQILTDNRCVNEGDGHLKAEWFTEEFQEKYQKLVDEGL